MNTRPPPPQGAPPSYAFVTRVYRRNLRPVVITVAFLAGLWSLFSGIGFFRNAPIYNNNNANKLGTLSVVIGIMYMVVMGIEIFGIFAASTQKLPFVRVYAYLSALVALIIAASGLMQTVVHFTLKNDIINTCTNVSTGNVIVYTGIFGPVRGGVLDQEDAAAWCNRSWNRGSWSEIIAFLITTVLAGMFSAIAFNYLHQLLDPTSAANVARGPNQHRMGAFPSHYNPPYNPNGPSYAGYGGPGGGPGYYPYPAPAGPPPDQSTDAFVPPYEAKPPGYVRGDDYKGGYDDQQKKGYDMEHEEGGSNAERDVTSRPGPFR